MKKIALSIIGGSLFVAGYYHVHRQAAYVAAKNVQPTSSVIPVTVSPIKSLPTFAIRSEKHFLDSAF